MWLVEFSLAQRIPVACFSCHKINKISISCLNYSRKQEILLKNLLQNQQNLKARGIYSCTGIYFFKSAFSGFVFVCDRCSLNFFSFRNLEEMLCVLWALSLVERVTVWALKLPVPHTDVLKTHNPQSISSKLLESQATLSKNLTTNKIKTRKE